MKIGRLIYKDLTKKNINSDDKNESIEREPSGLMNKRKLNMSEEKGENGIGGVAKLAKFGFSQDD